MIKTKMTKDWMFWKYGDDVNAEKVQIPHDAMLTEKRNPKLENGNASGFYPGGKYVYQKMIYGEEEYKGKSILIEFEGVYMNSKVLLNGTKVGGWIYGYTNFFVDLTGKLKIGEENELKVIVDNSKTPNSRWYSGSGIYRDVNLYVGSKPYIEPDGIKVVTKSLNPVVLEVEVVTKNALNCKIKVAVSDGENKVAEQYLSSENGEKGEITILAAKLWNEKNPNLYTIKAELLCDSIVVDESEIKTGFRTLNWNSKNGFMVNGETVKLKGACIHHDNGPLGARSIYKAEYRRVKKLKELGYNAIRYSHNPTGRLLLEICDEMGMYVIDETFDQWKIPQSTYDYAMYFDTEWKKDVTALVKKDYSHPCVIMYCVGNEITDTGLVHGAKVCQMIVEKFKELDENRPTIIANNVLLSVMAKKMAEQKAAKTKDNIDIPEDEKQVGSQDVNNVLTLLPKIMASITPENQEELLQDVFKKVDIVGYNYGETWYEGTHEMVPERVMLSSETFPCRIGENWKRVMESSYLIGDFMWTAWDYLGEAGVGLPYYGSTQAPFSKEYPCLTAGCGSVDLTGYIESQGYYTSIVYGTYKKPYIAVRPVNHAGEEYTIGRWRLTDAVNSWSWPGCKGKTAEIEVYSIGAEVELFQDDQSLGRKSLELCRAFYQTKYQEGKLKVVSFDEQGAEIGRCELVSANTSEVLMVMPEEPSIKADGEDLAYINIQITDDEGVVKLLRDRKLVVSVEGAGTLIALASGNPETTEYFNDSSYTSYNGRLLAIVQNNGERGDIFMRVNGEGLEEKTLKITAN